MRKWWNDLTPGQRRLFLLGVPVVAVFALIVTLRGGGRGAPPDDDEDGGPSAAVLPGSFAPTASTDAIGVGQLASYEDAMTAELDAMRDEMREQPAATPDPATTAQPSADQRRMMQVVRHEFARAGVALSDYGKGRTAPAGETAEGRVERIAYEINQGIRTVGDLRGSLQWIKDSYR